MKFLRKKCLALILFGIFGLMVGCSDDHHEKEGSTHGHSHD